MWNHPIITGVFDRMDISAREIGEAGAIYAGEAGKEWKNI